jgi:hypothetical protein
MMFPLDKEAEAYATPIAAVRRKHHFLQPRSAGSQGL